MKKETIDYSVTFKPDDTMMQKLKKAAHVKPSPAQLAWMEKEYVGFIHYSPNTFNHRQWGNGTEKVSDYHPDNVDAAQWCSVCSEAGMKMIVFTAKHHDGFCQWDTKTTDFSSMNSPAAVDVMQELCTGCQTYGLELGVYLSPWDMHQRNEGLWPKAEYNKYFLTQLEELLTNYGTIGEVWFDGACSDFGIWKAVPDYSPQSWYDLIEQLQPMAVVRLYDPHTLAGEKEWKHISEGKDILTWEGKGVRWVGNEGGTSRKDEWSVQPVFDREIAENATWKDLGEEKYYENAVGAIWYPLEVNTVVLNQWFWNEKTSVARSLTDLIEVYYNSIGNNGVLLLNVSPDIRGVIGEDQRQRLLQLRDYVEETFRVNLAGNAIVHASGEVRGHAGYCVLDDNKMTYWTPGEEWDIEEDYSSLIFDLGEERRFDQVLVQEFIREGQRVAGWNLEIWKNGCWTMVVQHKTIGYKTIKRFEPVSAAKIRLNILRSWDSPMISGFGLYLSSKIPSEEKKQNEELVLHPWEVDSRSLQAGLQYCCYDAGVQSAALLDSVFAVKVIESGTAMDVSERCINKKIGYSLSFEGYLYIPEDGSYDFFLENADGGLMYLGEHLLINNDEPHERNTVQCTAIMKKGYYPIKVLYTSFRNHGFLRMNWASQNFKLKEVSREYFYHIVTD